MTQTLVLVAVFVFLLALLPMGVKWLKQRAIGSVAAAPGSDPQRTADPAGE